jgi:gentisate 1,2-dioxygenase
MATATDSIKTEREKELELIINELEELNEEAKQKSLWIRTRWNLPNQKSWHLGTSERPEPGPYTLGVEYPAAQPCVWKWADIEDYLMQLVELCPLELTERQSVLLTNPAFGTKGVKVTNTMRIAISIYKKGDVAESHMHSPNASRTIISESGGYTMVEGEKIYPVRGDLVFTPNGTWHGHGNDDDSPVIWADTLDWPLTDFLQCAWGRNDDPNEGDNARPDEGFSTKFYGRGGLKPLFDVHGRGEGRKVTPMFLYKATDIRSALDDWKGYDGDPHEGIIMECINPTDGEPVFSTISYRAQMLRPGEQTLPLRHTASTIYFVLDGEGYTEVDGERFEWGKSDFFVVPNHRWRHFVNTGSENAILYSYTDAPLIDKIGHYRVQGKDKSGAVVELY